MRLKPGLTPNSLINVHVPMKLRKNIKTGLKYDCPDKQCTVCTSYYARIDQNEHNEGLQEDFVVDRLEV